MIRMRRALVVTAVAGTVMVGLIGCSTASSSSDDALFPATIGQYKVTTPDKAYAVEKAKGDRTFNAKDGKSFEDAVTQQILPALDPDGHPEVQRTEFYLNAAGNDEFVIVEVRSPGLKAQSFQNAAARALHLSSAQSRDRVIQTPGTVTALTSDGWVFAGSISGNAEVARTYAAILSSHLTN